MSALALQREAAAAIAQAEALETAELEIGDSIRTDPSSLDLQNEIATRTNEMLKHQLGLTYHGLGYPSIPHHLG